ncbi:MAG: hypothetical protein Q8Q59_08115 [Luteolibacter sp.]|jgi:hypothetical protein|nr:hypothetical protein [Luteolibacter sp.]
MKLKYHPLRHALFALASGIIGTASSFGALVVTPQAGDIFLGVRATGGIGSTTSYLVNLGNDLTFRNATPGSTTTLTLGNLGADLAAQYGAGWFAREDLQWGIFGLKNSASPTVYASQERGDPGVQGTPWPALNNTARSNAASNLASVIDGVFGYRNLEATANSTVAGFQTNASGLDRYATQVGTAGTTDFGSLSQWSSIEGTIGGAEASVLDFYRISGSSITPVQYLGNFGISNTGSISFTAVPEPSGALLGGLGTLLLLTKRRRNA